MNPFFDTHAAFQKLVEAGFTEKQAEAQIELQTTFNSELFKKNLVTKEYLDLKLKETGSGLESKIMFKTAGLLITQTAVLTAIMIAIIKLL